MMNIDHIILIVLSVTYLGLRWKSILFQPHDYVVSLVSCKRPFQVKKVPCVGSSLSAVLLTYSENTERLVRLSCKETTLVRHYLVMIFWVLNSCILSTDVRHAGFSFPGLHTHLSFSLSPLAPLALLCVCVCVFFVP